MSDRRCVLLALAAASTLACDEPAAPGTVDVRWRTGQLSCAEAGVASVRAELFGYGAIDPVVGIERVCPEGGTVLEEVIPGEYTLRLAGFDADGCWTHEAREDLRLVDGDEIEVDLPLLRRVRPLWVRWPFENELDCAGNGVEEVQITIEVEDRFTWIETFICPGLGIDIPVEVPSGDLRVEVVGLDARRTPVASGAISEPEAVFTDQPCDDRIELRVPLTLCLSPGCEGEVD